MDLKLQAADILKDQVSSIVWTIITTFGGLVFLGFRLLSRRLKWLVKSFTLRLILVQVVIVFLASGLLIFLDVLPVLLILCILLAAAPIWMLSKFRRMGIASVFLKTSNGINFDRSLKLSQKDFKFLGIGAHKLLESKEFDAAITRCSTDGRTSRFLLSDPENPALERMARRNGVDPVIYKGRVNETIAKLERMRNQRGLNISIRLYKNDSDADYQRFRLLFIDEEVCLLSWNVWGGHEGRENPQLILRNVEYSGAPGSSMYKAFQDYFEAIWEQATVH